MNRIDGNDVGMLQLRQGLWFVPVNGRHFYHYRSAGEHLLFRQKDAGKRPAPELMAKAETEQLIPGDRQGHQPAAERARSATRTQQGLMFQQIGEGLLVL